MSYIIDNEFYARVLDQLARTDGIPAVHLAAALCEDTARVKRVLKEAAELGHAVRRGRARGTTWWLG